jgi:hypothetical protein
VSLPPGFFLVGAVAQQGDLRFANGTCCRMRRIRFNSWLQRVP